MGLNFVFCHYLIKYLAMSLLRKRYCHEKICLFLTLLISPNTVFSGVLLSGVDHHYFKIST